MSGRRQKGTKQRRDIETFGGNRPAKPVSPTRANVRHRQIHLQVVEQTQQTGEPKFLCLLVLDILRFLENLKGKIVFNTIGEPSQRR